MTVLSFGGGQDSTAILYLLAYDKQFYSKYVKGPLVIVMSNTGDEHDETYHHVEEIQAFCQKHMLNFHLLNSEDGYHPRTWPDLITWMKNHDGIMSKAYPKSCTGNLKVVPIYNFLDAFIGRNIYFEFEDHRESRKKFIKRYAQENGKIRILLGIAAGEETRIGGQFPSKWMNDSLERVYPLIDLNLDRAGCQQVIREFGHKVPPPSNCVRCPFMNEVELLWMYRFYPDHYHEWVELEANKIRKWEALGMEASKNLGVNGTKLLPEALQIAIDKHGHMTDTELMEYKFSHGHCVKSKF